MSIESDVNIILILFNGCEKTLYDNKRFSIRFDEAIEGCKNDTIKNVLLSLKEGKIINNCNEHLKLLYKIVKIRENHYNNRWVDSKRKEREQMNKEGDSGGASGNIALRNETGMYQLLAECVKLTLKNNGKRRLYECFL
ncbi:hypothetical protein MBCUT_06510 [Methanobrevibacter cuticularis]|uniref:Uncharacterized protein n=1 Tax=Methanobrevibacter cuticularis TaxID=47311 RepID=A0A166EG30_9EURY|nr:hypothetical protein [Methanobrevibacter cuticularis]KZX16613.1 hypothetical protein MBCUT_06510 [Methanobrevibacter cuticularis]